jgi:hypothetical protein
VKLVLQDAPREYLELPGLTLKAVSAGTGTAQLDLHWSFAEMDEELSLTLTYSRNHYDGPLSGRLLNEH